MGRQLSKINVDESKIAPENRIPRATAATWFAFAYFNIYQNGADAMTTF
jgi:hypothetical protein